MATITAADLTMQWDEDNTFPFVEDENANITGYGHQDPAAFAAEVNRYDKITSGEAYPEDERWGAEHIGHRWAVANPDGESLTVKNVTAETPGAFPITTLWGQR